MDIKLISFADKVTGASDATGKIAADDMNQIKKALNGIISNCFNLDNTNTAISGVIKASALPTVDIFTNNFSTDFVVSGGVIALSGLPQLPVAPPLTDGVVDDDANTFTGTLPDGYSVTDLEATFNGGSTWATITALPLEVGDVSLAAGQVGLRIKATSERQHSATLYNATAFTSSAGNTDPDAGFSPLSLLPASNFNNGFSISGANNNELDAAYTGSGTDYAFGNVLSMKIGDGTAAIIRMNPDPNQANSVPIGIFMGLKVGTNLAGYKNMVPAVCIAKESSTSCKLQVIYDTDGTGNNPQYFTSNSINFTVPLRTQIRCTGTRIYAEYSLDGGNTWTDIAPGITITQPAGDLYLKAYQELYQAGDAGSISNIIQQGMVAVS